MDQHRTPEQLDLTFGPEPPMPALGPTLVAGRRALRRRRLATGTATLAVAGVLGAGWALGAGGGAVRGVDPAPAGPPQAPPTTTPSEPPAAQPIRWRKHDVARFVRGELVVRPGATVHQRVDNPYGLTPPEQSVALDATVGGERGWYTVQLHTGEDGEVYGSSGWSEPSAGWDGFEDWLADQVAANRGGPGGARSAAPGSADERLGFLAGRLVGVPGELEVVEQVVGPDLPDSFAGPGDQTAAAVVEEDGVRSFVLVREIGTETGAEIDVIDGGRVDGRSLAGFVEDARAAYASGEGLR